MREEPRRERPAGRVSSILATIGPCWRFWTVSLYRMTFSRIGSTSPVLLAKISSGQQESHCASRTVKLVALTAEPSSASAVALTTLTREPPYSVTSRVRSIFRTPPAARFSTFQIALSAVLSGLRDELR